VTVIQSTSSSTGGSTAAPDGVAEHRPLEAVRGSWAELVSAALVGTERRAFAPGPAIPAGTDPAQALLQQAMLAAVPALTGSQPAQYRGLLPEPAPADDRPLIPRAAQLRLRAVLDVYPKYLGEWLAAVQASGRRLPPAAMPGLLDAGRSNVSIRSALSSVLGAAGQWLARQNPDWRYLLREPFGPLRAEDWTGPDPDARIAYANGLYATDPAAARALLAAAWPTLTAATKLNLLALVTRHGTKADLPFIRGLNQDSSKQVREEAHGIEAQLKRREEVSAELSPETFVADARRLTAAEGVGNELYRFAMERAHVRWPLDGARVILAALVEYSREKPAKPGGNPAAAEYRRSHHHWAAQQLVGVLADHAPLALRPEAERLVEAQAAEIAAGAVHLLDFADLLAPLGVRADMHAELDASADAAPGQE
jgi:hypothetical protein